MKRLFTLSLICIAITSLLASCSSNLNITKRHYTKGYFVSRNHGYQPKTSNSKEITKANTENNVAVFPSRLSDSNAICKNEIAVNSDKDIVLVDKSSQNPDVNTSNNQTTKNQTTKNNKFKSGLNSKFQKLAKRFVETPIYATNIKHKKLSVRNDAHEGDGYSLFWIIILILLILWLIGSISTGFLIGSLINLVLLVALILLILWLLRIV